MNYRWLTVFLITFSANAQPYQFKTEVIEQFDDVKVVAFVSEADIEHSMQWDPMKEPPPLSIEAAVNAINKQYLESTNGSGSLLVTEIELRQLPQHKNYWHYIIKGKADSEDIYYFVLMSGKVIPAIVETESVK